MKHLRTLFLSAIAFVIAVSCKEEEPSIKDEISASPAEVALLADGSSKVIVNVKASSNDWKIVKNSESVWISAIPEDDSSVLVSASVNTAATARDGYFSLVCGSASQIVKVSQAAAKQYTITTDKNIVDLDASGAPPQTIKVSANGDWAVSIDSAAPWIVVTPMSGTEGDSIISVSAEVNTVQESRSGEFILSCGKASTKVTVSQAAALPPSKKVSIKFGTEEPVEIECTSPGIYESIVSRPASGIFHITIEEDTFGFLSHSGAGGLGDNCTDQNSGLPLAFLGSIPYQFVVNKAIGSMDKSDEKCPFTLSYSEAGKMKVRIDINKDVPTYYLEDYVEDSSVVYNEQFDLLLGGGSYSIAMKTYTTPMKDGKGDAYGQWNTAVSKYTQPDFNGAFWDGNDATATKGLCKEFLEALGIDEWVGVEGSKFGYQFQALHIGSAACELAAVYSPKFKALTGPTDVAVNLDLFRFATGTTADVSIEVTGGGQISEGETTVDYTDWNDRTPKTETWNISSPVTSYILVDNEYFSHTTKWNDTSAASENSKILKPISHMKFTIIGATPETRLYISSAANQRIQIHGLKVIRK